MEKQKVNRIGEIILTIFGILASIVGIFLTFGFNSLMKMQDFQEEFFNEMATEGISAEESSLVLDMFQSGGTYLGIVAILSTIAGLIGVLLFVGDKHSKTAGIILIIAAVVVLLASIGTGLFAFIFYLIAGIMGVVRKPPVPSDDYNFTIRDDDDDDTASIYSQSTNNNINNQ